MCNSDSVSIRPRGSLHQYVRDTLSRATPRFPAVIRSVNGLMSPVLSPIVPAGILTSRRLPVKWPLQPQP